MVQPPYLRPESPPPPRQALVVFGCFPASVAIVPDQSHYRDERYTKTHRILSGEKKSRTRRARRRYDVG